VENRIASKKGLFVVILLALLLSLPWIDRAFYSRGEPREALVAQAMVTTGNWISPPSYDGAVPSKPPFSHWLISLVSFPQGDVNESTSRLPSAVAFVVFCASFYAFLARRMSTHTALLATLILLTSSEWFRSAATCRVDTILSASLAGALLALFSWSERGRKGAPWLAVLLISFSALTKGPVGIVLPIGIYSLYELLVGGINRATIARIVLRGMLISLPVVVLVSGWYVAGYIQRGDVFLEKVWYENFARFASTMEDEPHKHSVFYLIGMLLLGLLPWSIAWLWLVVSDVKGFGARCRSWRSLWANATPLQKFSFLSASCIFLFFCIPSSKRSVYLLPAYPFIAILAAESAGAWGMSSKRLLAALSKILVVFAGIVAVGAVMVVAFPITPDLSRFREAFVAAITTQKLILVLGLVVALRAWGRDTVRELQRSPVGQLGFSVWLTVVICSFLVVDPICYQLSPKGWLMSPSVLDSLQVAKHEKLYSFGSEQYGISFYLKKPFFGARRDIPVGSLVFVEQRNIERLKGEIAPNVREVGRFKSGLEPEKKVVVVVEVGPS
jgi:4-amino-4-deoxy-L-arabinose transferase-like glycosyltransferase